MAIATTTNPRVSTPAIESNVLGERVNELYHRSRSFHLAGIGMALLLAALFSGHASNFAWASAVVLVELASLAIATRFRHKDVLLADARAWLWLSRASSATVAVGWGCGVILLLPSATIEQQVLLALVLVTVVATALPAMATDFFSFLLFALVAALPTGVALMFGGNTLSLVAGLVCTGAIALLVLVASGLFQSTIRGIRDRFAYADIVEEFDAEVTTRINAENTLRHGERRGRRQSYALLDLAKEDAISAGDLPRALEVVTEKAAQAIDCTRVSVWFCEPDFTEFRCEHIYDNGYHDPSPGIRIAPETPAKMFRRLERMRTFAVTDAHADNRVQPFLSTYLAPYRVSSLLGAPFRQGGTVRGFVVVEHVGGLRKWGRDERTFASSLADFLSLALAASGRVHAQEQLKHLANFDRLTSLPNRAMFHDRLSHALCKAERTDREVGLLFVDVDRFKAINDSLGHHSGDRVLRGIAKRLMRSVRKSDTVARLGGDEFTVILEDIEDLETVITVCERILETVAEPLVIDETEITLTCSIGIAMYPSDASEVDLLLRNADTAMYRAKQGGRNGYRFFTADMHAQAMQRLERESDLRKALQRNEFTLVYQPQVDSCSGRTVGLEALVRWQHPTRGLVSPQEFIPLAEETGLIPRLGEWVLKEACRQACVWRKQFDRDFHIAVNLSAGQFIMRNVPELVQEVLSTTGLPPAALLLEITESLAVGEAESTLVLLEDLKRLGCRLALDDFGTGNSSLSYLKRFPVDIIKVDRSFVRDLDEDAHDAAIARATIGLARSLGLDVVAEGVETNEQLRWLQREGCFVMQGYLFSKPLTEEGCERWLSRSEPALEGLPA